MHIEVSFNIEVDEVSGYLFENVTDPEFLRRCSKQGLIRRILPTAQRISQQIVLAGDVARTDVEIVKR